MSLPLPPAPPPPADNSIIMGSTVPPPPPPATDTTAAAYSYGAYGTQADYSSYTEYYNAWAAYYAAYPQDPNAMNWYNSYYNQYQASMWPGMTGYGYPGMPAAPTAPASQSATTSAQTATTTQQNWNQQTDSSYGTATGGYDVQSRPGAQSTGNGYNATNQLKGCDNNFSNQSNTNKSYGNQSQNSFGGQQQSNNYCQNPMAQNSQRMGNSAGVNFGSFNARNIAPGNFNSNQSSENKDFGAKQSKSDGGASGNSYNSNINSDWNQGGSWSKAGGDNKNDGWMKGGDNQGENWNKDGNQVGAWNNGGNKPFDLNKGAGNTSGQWKGGSNDFNKASSFQGNRNQGGGKPDGNWNKGSGNQGASFNKYGGKPTAGWNKGDGEDFNQGNENQVSKWNKTGGNPTGDWNEFGSSAGSRSQIGNLNNSGNPAVDNKKGIGKPPGTDFNKGNNNWKTMGGPNKSTTGGGNNGGNWNHMGGNQDGGWHAANTNMNKSWNKGGGNSGSDNWNKGGWETQQQGGNHPFSNQQNKAGYGFQTPPKLNTPQKMIKNPDSALSPPGETIGERLKRIAETALETGPNKKPYLPPIPEELYDPKKSANEMPLSGKQRYVPPPTPERKQKLPNLLDGIAAPPPNRFKWTAGGPRAPGGPGPRQQQFEPMGGGGGFMGNRLRPPNRFPPPHLMENRQPPGNRPMMGGRQMMGNRPPMGNRPMMYCRPPFQRMSGPRFNQPPIAPPGEEGEKNESFYDHDEQYYAESGPFFDKDEFAPPVVEPPVLQLEKRVLDKVYEVPKSMLLPFLCKLCNVSLPNPSQAEMHYIGKSHQKKERNYISELENRDIDNRKRNASQCSAASDDDSKDSTMTSKYCGICGISFTSETQAKQHYDGKNHRKRITTYCKEHGVAPEDLNKQAKNAVVEQDDDDSAKSGPPLGSLASVLQMIQGGGETKSVGGAKSVDGAKSVGGAGIVKADAGNPKALPPSQPNRPSNTQPQTLAQNQSKPTPLLAMDLKNQGGGAAPSQPSQMSHGSVPAQGGNVSKAKKLECDLCQVKMTSKQQLEAHFEGARHMVSVTKSKQAQEKAAIAAANPETKKPLLPLPKPPAPPAMLLNQANQWTSGELSESGCMPAFMTNIQAQPFGFDAPPRFEGGRGGFRGGRGGGGDASRGAPRGLHGCRLPSGGFYCKTCNVTLADENQFVQHCVSKKHKMKVASSK